jgi:hypothetical protein
MLELRNALRRDKWIHLLVILVASYALIMSFYFNYDLKISIRRFLSEIIIIEGVTLFVFLIIYLFKLFKMGEKSPISALSRLAVKALREPAELISFILMNIGVVLFISCFSFLKSMIPVLNPFSYDVQFAQIDQFLHFGLHPWEIVHGILDSPHFTAFISFMYSLWFFLFWGILFMFILLLKQPELRQQYIVSFYLCWFVVGVLFATLLSSGGPIFYEYIVDGNDVYQPLMDRLKQQDSGLVDSGAWVHVWALNIRDLLWERYINAESGLGSGISAMPSMHVSIAVLMALGVSQLNKYWGFVFWFYAFVIMIGSVHLAWHYAIDGYVSFILTYIIWKVTGWSFANIKWLKT